MTKSLIKRLINKEIESNVGIILVGSHDTHFETQYSDIDLIIVTEMPDQSKKVKFESYDFDLIYIPENSWKEYILNDYNQRQGRIVFTIGNNARILKNDEKGIVEQIIKFCRSFLKYSYPIVNGFEAHQYGYKIHSAFTDLYTENQLTKKLAIANLLIEYTIAICRLKYLGNFKGKHIATAIEYFFPKYGRILNSSLVNNSDLLATRVESFLESFISPGKIGRIAVEVKNSSKVDWEKIYQKSRFYFYNEILSNTTIIIITNLSKRIEKIICEKHQIVSYKLDNYSFFVPFFNQNSYLKVENLLILLTSFRFSSEFGPRNSCQALAKLVITKLNGDLNIIASSIFCSNPQNARNYIKSVFKLNGQIYHYIKIKKNRFVSQQAKTLNLSEQQQNSFNTIFSEVLTCLSQVTKEIGSSAAILSFFHFLYRVISTLDIGIHEAQNFFDHYLTDSHKP